MGPIGRMGRMTECTVARRYTATSEEGIKRYVGYPSARRKQRGIYPERLKTDPTKNFVNKSGFPANNPNNCHFSLISLRFSSLYSHPP